MAGRTAAAPGTTAPAALARAAHAGPTLAVTVVAGLLAEAAGHGAGTVLAVLAAVLAGQLTIGWGNDLVDARRDRAVGRRDKPLATGELATGTVRTALLVAALAVLALSTALGWRAGVLHLVCVVGAGHAYNLGLKATAWSWTPYAVAFGSLPAVAWLAGPDPAGPPAWTLGAGAALGVGAHFLNTLPDLAEDAATGVRGLPHRLGERASRTLAAGLLVAASVLAVLGPAGAPPAWSLAVLAAVAALGLVAMVGTGRAPFRAAMAIALVDVVLLVAVSR